jgi:5-methylcytosine-specific restriction endonuclease McrA
MNDKRIKQATYNARANARYNGLDESANNLSPTEWTIILEQSNGRCHYCATFFGVDALVLEHKIPLSRGGTNTAPNVVASCKNCNKRKMTNTDYKPPTSQRIW